MTDKAASKVEPRVLSAREFAHTYTTGDGNDWAYERTWITGNHPRRLARIRREIRCGTFPPVVVDDDDSSVMDGHHRVVAALMENLPVPYIDYREDSEWESYTDTGGSDDPA